MFRLNINKIRWKLNVVTSLLLTSFLAGTPRETVTQGVDGVQNVEQSPGHDDNVVDVLQEDHGDGRIAHPLEDGAQLTDNTHASYPKVLSNGHLQQEERYPAREHGNKVGNEERSCIGGEKKHKDDNISFQHCILDVRRKKNIKRDHKKVMMACKKSLQTAYFLRAAISIRCVLWSQP